MNRMKRSLLAGLIVLIAGCDSPPPEPIMPEVNNANCQMAQIMKIEDRATRETFAGLCSRQPPGNGIGSTEQPLNWLDLTAPDDQGERP